MVPARSDLRFSRIVANEQKVRATNCATFGNSVPVKFSLSAGASAHFLNDFSWRMLPTFQYSSCLLLPEVSLWGRWLTSEPSPGRRAENHQSNPY
jgi:hypothetical protein